MEDIRKDLESRFVEPSLMRLFPMKFGSDTKGEKKVCHCSHR